MGGPDEEQLACTGIQLRPRLTKRMLLAILLFFEIILAPLLLAIIAPQLLAGFYARSVGRGFWFWFWISFVIPIISLVILMYLPEKEKVGPETLTNT